MLTCVAVITRKSIRIGEYIAQLPSVQTATTALVLRSRIWTGSELECSQPIRLVGRFASRPGWWWFVSAIVGIICAVACYLMRRHERFFAADTVSSALFGWYLTLIAAFTIFARRPRDVGQRFNLDVFNTIAERFAPGRESEYEVILYFVMLVSLGMLLLCIKDCGVKHVAIAALCLATIIESLQLILSAGTFELVDIVENTSGAILGYSIYALLRHLRVC